VGCNLSQGSEDMAEKRREKEQKTKKTLQYVQKIAHISVEYATVRFQLYLIVY